MEDANAGMVDYIDWAGDRVRGHGNAASEGFEHDQAEGIGKAGEDEDIGGGVVTGEFFTMFHADKVDVGIFLAEGGELRAIADDEFGAGEGELEEGFDVFFDGDAADVQEDGTRCGKEGFLAGTKKVGINAAGPADEAGEAAGAELAFEGRGGDHDSAGRLVEPAHGGIACAEGEADTGVDVLRKFCCVGRCEGEVMADAEVAGGEAEGAFSGDVNRVRREGGDDFCDAAARQDSKANGRIGGARNCFELVGGYEANDKAHLFEVCGDRGERADDTVDLREPSIGNDEDAGARGKGGVVHVRRTMSQVETAVMMVRKTAAEPASFA